MSSYRVLGIDPSLTNTGVCVVEDGQVIFVHTLRPMELGVLPMRLQQLRALLAGVLLEYQPMVVAMEAEIFARPGQSGTAAVQAILQDRIYDYLLSTQVGAATPWAIDWTGQFLSVNVAHVKKWLGASEKKHVLLQVFKRYGREFRDDNQADAFTIAMIADSFCALHYDGKTWPEWTKPQLEVLEKLAQTGRVWAPRPEKKARGKSKAAVLAPRRQPV